MTSTPTDETETPMTSTLNAPTPDLAAIKLRQQQTWASGDLRRRRRAGSCSSPSNSATRADLHAGWRVLDVATGSGNAAIAAARHGCTAVGVDYVPAPARARPPARRRRGARGRAARGDAEALPFPDASFDAVMSVFGTMFAPDHARTAAELLRVCRPGGTIALASWTPDGFIGELFRTVGAHVPPPAGLQSPLLWGTESHLRELFGEGIASLEVAERTYTWRFASAEDFVAFFRHLVRADAEGLRGAGGRRTRRAGERSGRAGAPVRPPRQRRRDRHPVDLHRSRGERALTGKGRAIGRAGTSNCTKPSGARLEPQLGRAPGGLLARRRPELAQHRSHVVLGGPGETTSRSAICALVSPSPSKASTSS